MNNRNYEINVRLTQAGMVHLNRLVNGSKLSREAYLRQLIAGVVPQDAPPPDYFSMMQQLYRIGNNLNQIALKAMRWVPSMQDTTMKPSKNFGRQFRQFRPQCCFLDRQRGDTYWLQHRSGV